MKLLLTLTLSLFSSLVAFAGTDSFYNFEDQEGRTLQAKIINFDARRNQVELQRKNGRRAKVDPAIFTEESQNFIRDWKACQVFESTMKFKISGEKEQLENWKKNDGGIIRNYEKLAYSITFENGSQVDLPPIQVEYQIFYEQEVLEPGAQITQKEYISHTVELEELKKQSDDSIKTKSIIIYKQHLAGGYDGYIGGLPDRQNGDLKGIWLKLTLKTASGLTAIRELEIPKSLKADERRAEYTLQGR